MLLKRLWVQIRAIMGYKLVMYHMQTTCIKLVSQIMMEVVSSTQRSHALKMVANLWEKSWWQNILTFASQTSWVLNVCASNHTWQSPRPSQSTHLLTLWWRWFPASQVEQGPVMLMQLLFVAGFCILTMHWESCRRKWHADWTGFWICCRPKAYCAMVQHFIALDKQPGACPVGIGEIWQHLLAKLVLDQAGEQARLAYNSLQLCAELEAGIEGTLHAAWKWVQSESKHIWEIKIKTGMRTAYLRANSLRTQCSLAALPHWTTHPDWQWTHCHSLPKRDSSWLM